MQILEEAAQKPKDKNRAKEFFLNFFRSLFWKHPDHPVSRIVLKGDPKYFSKKKQKPFQVSGKLRLSDWHINKSLKYKTKLNQDILL